MTVHRCSIFMHDGGPCYRARIVSSYLAEKNIQVVEWPGNSPDLNPIENMWSVMKNKASEKQPLSLKVLEIEIKVVWTQEFSNEYCQGLIASMPRRIQAHSFFLHDAIDEVCAAKQSLHASLTQASSIGRPDVDSHVRHESEAAVLFLVFLVNEGALVSATADSSIHMWNYRQKKPEIVHSLKFQRERVTSICLPFQSKWLYVGSERGNVHIVNIESFTLSGYIINWNKAIDLSRKSHPGPVVHLSDCPIDPGKLLIGFETGQIVVWDLRTRTADCRYQSAEPLRSISWHYEGKQFMCSHTDGSLTTWVVKQPSPKPTSTIFPHAKTNKEGKQDTCKPIQKVDWTSTRLGESFIIFSGGLANSSAGRTPSITVIHGKTTTVLEMEHNVVDFIALCESPWPSDFDDPYALVVLLHNDLVVVDLLSAGYPCFENPYSMDLHESPVTCCTYLADCPADLIGAFYSVGAAARSHKTGFSSKEWPICGGEWGSTSCSYPELIVTGHADGSLKFWDASSVSLQVLYKLKTVKVFEKDKTRGGDGSNDEDPFAIQHISMCPESRLLCVAGASSHLILYKYCKQETSSEIPCLEIPIVYEAYESGDYSPECEFPPRPSLQVPGSPLSGHHLAPSLPKRQPPPPSSSSPSSSTTPTTNSNPQQSPNTSRKPGVGPAVSFVYSLSLLPDVTDAVNRIIAVMYSHHRTCLDIQQASLDIFVTVHVRGGVQKKPPGYQAELVCLTPWVNGEPPGQITSVSINSSYGLIAYGNESGLVIVDYIQNTCLLNMGTPELYGAADPYQRVPRSPKKPDSKDKEDDRDRSPSSDQDCKDSVRGYHVEEVDDCGGGSREELLASVKSMRRMDSRGKGELDVHKSMIRKYGKFKEDHTRHSDSKMDLIKFLTRKESKVKGLTNKEEKQKDFDDETEDLSEENSKKCSVIECRDNDEEFDLMCESDDHLPTPNADPAAELVSIDEPDSIAAVHEESPLTADSNSEKVETDSKPFPQERKMSRFRLRDTFTKFDAKMRRAFSWETSTSLDSGPSGECSGETLALTGQEGKETPLDDVLETEVDEALDALTTIERRASSTSTATSEGGSPVSGVATGSNSTLHSSHRASLESTPEHGKPKNLPEDAVQEEDPDEPASADRSSLVLFDDKGRPVPPPRRRSVNLVEPKASSHKSSDEVDHSTSEFLAPGPSIDGSHSTGVTPNERRKISKPLIGLNIGDAKAYVNEDGDIKTREVNSMPHTPSGAHLLPSGSGSSSATGGVTSPTSLGALKNFMSSITKIGSSSHGVHGERAGGRPSPVTSSVGAQPNNWLQCTPQQLPPSPPPFAASSSSCHSSPAHSSSLNEEHRSCLSFFKGSKGPSIVIATATGSRCNVKRGGSERGDNLRRCRSQGTRARLVRALTTAGTTATSSSSSFGCSSGGAGSQSCLSTSPEDQLLLTASPPRSPGGPRSPTVGMTAGGGGVAVGGGGASWGGSSACGSGGGSQAHLRMMSSCSSTLCRHYHSPGIYIAASPTASAASTAAVSCIRCDHVVRS
ncbi:Lethal giant larvaeue 2 [Trinorchestia longiramus]|nr:Lethal giant larvaeue 2 [Trinorchestia longiramus]